MHWAGGPPVAPTPAQRHSPMATLQEIGSRTQAMCWGEPNDFQPVSLQLTHKLRLLPHQRGDIPWPKSQFHQPGIRPPGHSPIHNAPDPFSSSCRWWPHMRIVLCCFFGLGPAGWGSSVPSPGKGNLNRFFHKTLCLTSPLGPVCPGSPYQGQLPRQPPHHVKMPILLSSVAKIHQMSQWVGLDDEYFSDLLMSVISFYDILFCSINMRYWPLPWLLAG